MTPPYDSLPEDGWDGYCMLYSRTREEFYPDDVFFPEEDLSLLELVHTEPVYAPKLGMSFFDDVLPSDDADTSVKEVLLEAIDEFNDRLDGMIISWAPLDIRVALTPDRRSILCLVDEQVNTEDTEL